MVTLTFLGDLWEYVLINILTLSTPRSNRQWKWVVTNKHDHCNKESVILLMPQLLSLNRNSLNYTPISPRRMQPSDIPRQQPLDTSTKHTVISWAARYPSLPGGLEPMTIGYSRLKIQTSSPLSHPPIRNVLLKIFWKFHPKECPNILIISS